MPRALPSGSYPPCNPPHCYMRQNAVSTHIGLTAAACAAFCRPCGGCFAAAGCGAVAWSRTPYPRYVRENTGHWQAMACPAQAARATQHLSTRRSVMPLGRMAGRAGRCTTASSRCATWTQRLATTALDSPAPALCGLGFRRDRAGQPPNRTSIRAGNECVPVSRAVQRGRPRPTLRGADGQAQSNCVRFALEGPDRPCQSHKA